jgi:hypothetical protein
MNVERQLRAASNRCGALRYRSRRRSLRLRAPGRRHAPLGGKKNAGIT